MALTKATLIDLNANELILDLDADTSITADTDDTIHIKIGGSDEITITGTALSPSTSDGSSLGTSALEWSDLFLADGAVINFGDDQDVSLTHVADTGLLLSSTDQLQFGDSGTYIHQSADGVLDLVADTEIEINATTIDINGNVDISGTITIGSAAITEAELETIDGITAGTVIASKAIITDANKDITGGRNITISGELDAATGDFSGDVDIDGTANLDVVDIDGATQIDATVTVGVNDTGYDVKFFGATSGAYMLWDESVDDLILAGASRVVVPDGQLVLGSTAVTSTAAELNLLDGVSGLVQADLTKLAAIDATAAEINLIDGGTARGTTAVADADGILHNDDGTMRMTSAATFKTYFQEGISTAYDDLTAGDAAVNITTSSGNITIDAAANDSDIIFKGTDGGADTTFLTIDGSAAGDATFNNQIIVGDGKLVLGSTAVTSTAAEINLIDGGTARGTTAVADGDGILHNDNGTMRMTSAATFKTYFQEGLSSNVPSSADGQALGSASAEWSDLYLADGGQILFGNDQDVTLTHVADTGLILSVAGNTDALTIQSTDSDANAGPILKLLRNANSAADNDECGTISFTADNDANQHTDFARMRLHLDDVSDGTENGNLKFFTMVAGTERSRIGLASSETVFNEDSVDLDFRIESDNEANAFKVHGSNGKVSLTGNASVTGLGTTFDRGAPTGEWTLQHINARADGGGETVMINRQASDGTMIQFRHANTTEGTISLSGNTVSYNAFSGSHWGRLTDNAKPNLLRGTVIETIDEMMDWYKVKFTQEGVGEVTDEIALPAGKSVGDTISHTFEGVTYDDAVIELCDDIKHTKVKVSDTADSKRVYGVFMAWTFSENDAVNDMYVNAVGTAVIRIHKDVTVAAGDLLVSNGDGTAKVQDDDIIRSKTIGKVLTNIKQETYDDDSYIVPCALYCG